MLAASPGKPEGDQGHLARQGGASPKGSHLKNVSRLEHDEANIMDQIADHKAEHGHEHQDHQKVYEIIVNTRKKTWPKDHISYDELVELAFGHKPEGGNIIYAITYKGAASKPHDGVLSQGESVEIKNGTVFDVRPSDKS